MQVSTLMNRSFHSCAVTRTWASARVLQGKEPIKDSKTPKSAPKTQKDPKNTSGVKLHKRWKCFAAFSTTATMTNKKLFSSKRVVLSLPKKSDKTFFNENNLALG